MTSTTGAPGAPLPPRWIRRTLNSPRRTLVAFLASSLAMALALPRLGISTDGRDLFTPGHPALAAQTAFDQEMAPGDRLIVGLDAGEDGLFRPGPLGLLADLSRDLAAIPGVAADEVKSLATDFAPAWRNGMLHLEPPLGRQPENDADAQKIANAALGEPLFQRLVVTPDGRAAAIHVPLDSTADRQAVFEQAKTLIASARNAQAYAEAPVELHVLGSVVAELELASHILADLALLLPLALLVAAVILYAWFRSVAVVVVGLAEAGMVVVWSLGAMALCGVDLSLVTVVMPVILATYCVADTIHVAQRFRERTATQHHRPTAMLEALGEILKPVVATSLTTAAGFAAFAISPIPPLREFGVFTAFGVLFALSTSVLMVPSALLVLRFGRVPHAAKAPSRHLADRLARLGLRAVSSPWRVLAVMLLVSVTLGLGAFRIEIQDSWLRNFSPRSELARSDAWYNERFLGSNILNVVLETGEAGGARDPELLTTLQALQETLAQRPAVGGSLALTDPLRAVSRTLVGDDALPTSTAQVGEWILLYEMAGGARSLHPYLDADASALGLWIFLRQADYRKTLASLQEVDAFDWKRHLGDNAPQVTFAGDAYLGYRLVESIATSQRSSLLLALVVTLLAVRFLYGSFDRALLAVLPVSIALLWNFGMMGWLDIPLGISTSTFAAIALGIGIDFALHWLAGFDRARARGASMRDAVATCSSTVGVAVLLHGAVLLLGFGVLLSSSVPPNRNLGLQVCVNLAGCLLTSLLVLPAVATLVERSFPRIARRLGERTSSCREAAS